MGINIKLEQKEYLEELKKIETIVGSAIMVSSSIGGIKTNSRNIRAVQLYTKLTLSSMSIMRLLPHNTYCSMTEEIWDFASVSCLARSFLESYHMFFYVGIEKISEEEFEFRSLLMNYHRNYEKYKMYKGRVNDENVIKEFEEGLPKEKEVLSAHPFINTFSPEVKRTLLKGNKAVYLSQKQISERIPFNTEEFDFFYRFYSNHTHSSPLGFMSQSNVRGRGNENEAERRYLIYAMNLVGKYLSAAIIDISKIFPKQTKHLNKETDNAIKYFMKFTNKEN